MTTLNLSQAIFDKIESMGVGPAAVFFGRTEATIRKWAGGTTQPDVGAAQAILDEAMSAGTVELPSPVKEQGKTKPDEAPKFEHGRATTDGGGAEMSLTIDPVKIIEKAKKYSLLCPVNRKMSWAVVLSFLGQWKATLPEEIRKMLAPMDFGPDTTVHAARNMLATKFLASGNEWSIWMDSDMIVSPGNPAWMKKRTGMKHADKWFQRAALEQLVGRGKSFIGAVYVQRSHEKTLIAQPGFNPTGEEDRKLTEEITREGPRDQVVQVGWIGFGCVAIHRKVFEDILITQPETKSKNENDPHSFFNPIEAGPQGEDTAFAARALKAGHPCFLDLSVFCGHMGETSHNP